MATLLELDEPVLVDPGAVGVAVQRDSLSDTWRRRFIAERGCLSYLDGGLLFSRDRRGASRLVHLFLGPAG